MQLWGVKHRTSLSAQQRRVAYQIMPLYSHLQRSLILASRLHSKRMLCWHARMVFKGGQHLQVQHSGGVALLHISAQLGRQGLRARPYCWHCVQRCLIALCCVLCVDAAACLPGGGVQEQARQARQQYSDAVLDVLMAGRR